MSIKSTLTQTNSHAYKLTDMLVDEPPDISSDSKNFLLVYPTEAFLGKGKKNGIYVSVYLRNTDTKFVGVSSGVLSLVNWEKVDYAKLVTKAHQTSVSTERVAHFFIEVRIDSHSPQRETHPLQINDINTDDGVEVRSHFCFIWLNDDAVVQDRDNAIPIIREMDDDYHSKSDNIRHAAAVPQCQPTCCLDGLPARHDCPTAAAQHGDHR